MTKSPDGPIFKKILVPLDGSKYSQRALEQACQISRMFDSALVLAYVVENPLPINLLDRKEYLKMVKDFGNKTIDKANETLLKKGLIGKTLVKTGNIVNEIEKIIKKEKYDLVIVGSRGLGSAARLLLGSISNKLAHSASC